jgi:hypothetical protein
MPGFTEDHVEEATLSWLEGLGYAGPHGPDLWPDGGALERASYGDVILFDRLRTALARINPHLSPPIPWKTWVLRFLICAAKNSRKSFAGRPPARPSSAGIPEAPPARSTTPEVTLNSSSKSPPPLSVHNVLYVPLIAQPVNRLPDIFS